MKPDHRDPDDHRGETLSSPPKSIPVRAFRMLLRVISRASPELAGRAAFAIWFVPGRTPEHPDGRRVLETADRGELQVSGQRVQTYSWGTGPVVLLVHGWGSRAAHLTGFVLPLLEAGFRVVTLDAPAHGRSDGRRTDVWEIAGAIAALHRLEGPLHGAITHSFGTLSLITAMREHDAQLGRAVCLAPAVRRDSLLEAFARLLELPDPVRLNLEQRVLAFTGPELWDEAVLRVPTLIFHDRDDTRIPFSDSLAIEGAWPRTRLTSTRGLGHKGILRDPMVVSKAVAFLASEEAAAKPRQGT